MTTESSVDKVKQATSSTLSIDSSTSMFKVNASISSNRCETQSKNA